MSKSEKMLLAICGAQWRFGQDETPIVRPGLMVSLAAPNVRVPVGNGVPAVARA